MIDLVSHIEIAHPKAVPTKSNVEVPKDNIIEIEDLTCTKCSYECRENSDMFNHEKSQHSENNESTTANEESDSADDVPYVEASENLKSRKETEFNNDNVLSFKCHLCPFETNDSNSIDSHGVKHHGIQQCDRCDYRAEDKELMKIHMETHTGLNILPCGVCEFETTIRRTLSDHMSTKHGIELNLDQQSHSCSKCENTFVGMFRFKYHKCNPQSYKYSCAYKKCTFVGTDVSEVDAHTYDEHRKYVHCCQHCDAEFEDKIVLKEHMSKNHNELSIIASLLAQQNILCESFNMFKHDIGNSLTNLIQGQNYLKTEMMLLREGTSKESFQTQNQNATKVDDNASDDKSKEDTYAKKARKNTRHENDKKSRKEDSTEKDKDDPKSHNEHPDNSVPSKVLWIGDSNSNSLDHKVFENQINSVVDIATAYTIDNDKDAKYPKRNFLKVVPERLARKKYDTLVLQGGCNEVSNIQVKSSTNDVSKWEEKIRQSRMKLFHLAEDSLQKNSYLKNVIIVASLPRYDPEDLDPNGIKSKLNQFGNSVLSNIWMQKGCPKNISIHDLKLDCNGELRKKRFGNPGLVNDGKPWDGIHLRGPMGERHFTNSSTRMFASQFPDLVIDWVSNQSRSSNYHNACPQTEFRRRHFESTASDQENRQGFSQQGFRKQTNGMKGFKSNNKNGFRQGVYTENVYNIPVRNRFQGNF